MVDLHKLLITQPRAGTSHNEILALQLAARTTGWDVHSAEGSWRLPEDLIAKKQSGVPYGSQTFCEVIAQQMGWTLKGNSFDWLAKLPQKYLKRKVEFMTLDAAKKLQETKFIKPADDKVFPAGVYSPGTLITHPVVPQDTPTLVSDVVSFDLEYRCFVTQNQVWTWSNYVFFDLVADHRVWYMTPADNDTSKQFVEAMLDDLSIDDSINTAASVIDVGRIPGKGWAIIETNQAWASGLYGCDPCAALEVMEDASIFRIIE